MPTLTPSESLHGQVLPGGWRVVERLPRDPDSTGGSFSTQWIVERERVRAFLKATDIYKALQLQGEVLRALQQVTTEYTWERDLLKACSDGGMNRVVRALDDGEYLLDPQDVSSIVFYLIFDLAEGDIRVLHDLSDRLDVGRSFHSLHDVAVGVQQLHNAGIAHQDMKPSNLVRFIEEREKTKLADFGRASRLGKSIGHDDFVIAGDLSHAPPERLYGSDPPNWEGRKACDLYHLGSILSFLLTGSSATAAWLTHLDPQFHPECLGGTFQGSFDEALPYVRDALSRVFSDFPDLGDEKANSATLNAFQELCNPDPTMRGNPQNRLGYNDPWSVASYVSRFDYFSKRFDRMFVAAGTDS